MFSEIGCSATLFSVSSNCFSRAAVSGLVVSLVLVALALVFAAVSGTATCSARAGLTNRAEPIIKEQAPIDSLRIL